MKTCTKCLRSLSLDAFGRDARSADGKNARCKECVNAYFAERKDPERRREICAKYRSENQEKVRQAYRQWYEKDVAATRAKKRAYDARNVEQARARRAKWRAENRQKIAEIGQARRAAEGSHTAADLRRIRALQKGKCAHCCRDLNRSGFHVDHIVPLALGGANDAKNIQLLCPPCNLSKGAKHPIDFARDSGRLL